MQTSKEVVAGIIKDLPALKDHESELVAFMDRVKDLRGQMVRATTYHDRQIIANRIRVLAQKVSQNSNGEGRTLRNEALNRIFDHLEGREDD